MDRWRLLRAVTRALEGRLAALPLMPYPHFGDGEDDVHAVGLHPLAQGDRGHAEALPELSTELHRAHDSRAEHVYRRPSPSDKVAYGKYMVNAALCSDCHTPIDDQGQPLPGLDFAGGMEILRPATACARRTSRRTPTPSDRGRNSSSSTVKAFETAPNNVLAEHERAQNSPMPMTVYAGMAREDLSAIYAYLRTLKPVTHRVEKFPDAK